MRSDVYWIAAPGLAPGRLATSARPRGGDWLEAEVDGWRSGGVTHVVSLLTSAESRELELDQERLVCAQAGLEYLSVPVPDRGVPESRAEFERAAEALGREVGNGAHVLVHCRQGIGRASMLAAAILIGRGVDERSAWTAIERARGGPVPDTDEQRQWLHDVGHSTRAMA